MTSGSERRLRILAQLNDSAAGDLEAKRLCQVCAEVTGMSGAGIMLMSNDVPRGAACMTDEVSALIEDPHACECGVEMVKDRLGGALQMYLGEPDTTPRLDNVHRFLAGVYFSTGLINLWAAVTIRTQGALIFLLALGVLLAGIGRLVSMSQVGLPEPTALWMGYLISELL